MEHKGILAAWMVAVILFGAVCLGVGWWMWNIPSASENTPTSATPTIAPTTTSPLTAEERLVQLNEAVEGELYRPIYLLFGYKFYEVGSGNLLGTPKGRHAFAWQLLNQDGTIAKNRDEAITGVTGGQLIDPADYLALYQRIYGQSTTINELIANRSFCEMWGDQLFGDFVTGWGAPHFLLKAVSFEEWEGGATFCMNLIANGKMVTDDSGRTNWEWNYDTLFALKEPTVLDYPEEYVCGTLTLELTGEPEAYHVTSLYYTKTKEF